MKLSHIVIHAVIAGLSTSLVSEVNAQTTSKNKKIEKPVRKADKKNKSQKKTPLIPSNFSPTKPIHDNCPACGKG